MFLHLKLSSSKTSIARLEKWALNFFCLSTLFVIFFSVEAIHAWPSLIEKASILLACLLPVGMIIYPKISEWIYAKRVPKEIIWVVVIVVLGLTSSLLSETPWGSVKSFILFIISGPVILIATMYLFESKDNQSIFLWMMSIGMFVLVLTGIYEYNFNDSISLFSANPLPAGALLVLFFASPLILLSRKHSVALKFLLTIGVIFSVVLIILLAQKGPILALVIILLSVVIFISSKYLKLIFGAIFLIGCLLYSSYLVLSEYKGFVLSKNSKASVALRVENYFFGFYIFKENPIWGIGNDAHLEEFLIGYKLKFFDYGEAPYPEYIQYIKVLNALENTVLTALVERGSLFTVTYFGGLLYILLVCLKQLRSVPNNMAGLFLVSIIVGFAVILLLFDTLRFPNLNWVFHSLLGLLVNISNNQPTT